MVSDISDCGLFMFADMAILGRFFNFWLVSCVLMEIDAAKFITKKYLFSGQ